MREWVGAQGSGWKHEGVGGSMREWVLGSENALSLSHFFSIYESPDYRSQIGHTSLTTVTCLTKMNARVEMAMRQRKERGGGEGGVEAEEEGVAPVAAVAEGEELEKVVGVAKGLVQDLGKHQQVKQCFTALCT